MNKLIGYACIGLLLICLIIDSIGIYTSMKSSDVLTMASMFSQVIGTVSIALVVFYIDVQKTNSLLSKIGIGAVALYILISLFVLLSKNIGDLFNNLKFILILTYIIDALKYVGIMSFVSKENDDSIGQMIKIVTIGIISIYCLLVIGVDFGDIDYSSGLYKFQKELYLLLNFSFLGYIIYEYLDGSDDALQPVQQPVPQVVQQSTPEGTSQVVQNTTAPVDNPFMDAGKKFTNPALEAQEAMIREYEAQKQQQAQQPTQEAAQVQQVQQPTNNINNPQ